VPGGDRALQQRECSRCGSHWTFAIDSDLEESGSSYSIAIRHGRVRDVSTQASETRLEDGWFDYGDPWHMQELRARHSNG
jgi:hypothetical protein